MLVFVDESGDPGMSGRGGATEHFVVGLVLFEDNDQAEHADRRIDLLRPELGLPANFEFRFHACRPDIRLYFLNQLVPFTWFYYLAIAINKAKLWGPGFESPAVFYKYSTGLVFENAKPHLRDAIVVIDASSGKSFRMQLSRYLRRKIDRDGGLINFKQLQLNNSAANCNGSRKHAFMDALFDKVMVNP